MNVPRRIPPFVILVACCLCCVHVWAGEFASGAPLPVGTKDGVGPLAAVKISSRPLGAGNVFGGVGPDLFVYGGARYNPGVVLFPREGTSDTGVPVFGPPRQVTAPEYMDKGTAGTVFEHAGQVHALWPVGRELAHLVLDKGTLTFQEKGRVPMPKTPRGAHAIGWLPDEQGDGGTLLLGITDGTRGSPPMEGFRSTRDPRYDPYDGAGVWRGGFPFATLYGAHMASPDTPAAGEAVQIAPTDREVRSSVKLITVVDLGPGREREVVMGSHFGPIMYFKTADASPLRVEGGRMIAGRDGIAHRHPTIWASPGAYPNAKGQWCDLFVGGEGGLYFYKFTGEFTDSGQPVYEEPTPVLQSKADVYTGSLPVPNVVDWNGDGLFDVVTGNSEGRVLFCENVGTNESPAFLPGVPIEAGGRAIHLQSGYRGSIQGPFESRWGYVCPTVADWNADGLPDLLMSGATSEHVVYLNRGTRTAPRLDHGHSLYLDGLELHGTWRVKPAVGLLAGKMAYIALDDDDEFHLYWQLDVYNLADGGKLHLDTGGVIGANYLKSGGTGRIKISLTDWDGDGLNDLLIGTPRHASIPTPDKGLPQSLGKPGSGVLLMRNRGGRVKPVFSYPETLKFKGEDVFFGQHACGPTVAPFGRGDKPGLVVGVETGRLLWFAREDVSFGPPTKRVGGQN